MTDRRLAILNTSGETAPAFGIAEVADAGAVAEAGGAVDGQSTLVIRKPTGAGRVVAVGTADVEDDRYGTAFTGDAFVRFTGTDPSPGDTLYATSGSWALSAAGTGTGVTVAGDVRDMGAYKIVRVEIGPQIPQQGDFGIATLDEALLTTDTDVDIVGYTPVLGTSTPGTEPATVGNVNDLEGDDGATVIVVSTGDGWQVAAVLALTSEPDEVRTGRISTATAATFAHDGDVATAGELEVWETILPADVADYDTAESYTVGNFARESGTLYRCKFATGDPAGAFDAADWDSITPETDLRLTDRTQATVTLKHWFHEVAPEGALVEWDSQGIRILTCDAPADWEPY